MDCFPLLENFVVVEYFSLILCGIDTATCSGRVANERLPKRIGDFTDEYTGLLLANEAISPDIDIWSEWRDCEIKPAGLCNAEMELISIIDHFDWRSMFLSVSYMTRKIVKLWVAHAPEMAGIVFPATDFKETAI